MPEAVTPEILEASVKNALNAFETFKSDIAPKIGKLSAEDEAKLAKLDKAMADSIELSQKEAGARKAMEDQIKAQDAKVTALETALQRPGAGGTSEEKSKELKTKFKKAINQFARLDTGNRDMYFDDFVKQTFPQDAELKALSVGSDPDGGYLVTPEMGGIISTYVYESSPMRTLASVQQIGGLSYEYVVDNAEVGSGWVGETGTRSTTTTPTLNKITVTAHELYANPKATQTVLDDASIDMESWLGRKIGEKFARDEATAFIAGSGIAKPRGILNYTAGTTIASEQIEQVNTGDSSNFTYDGLIDLTNALKEPYQRNASFLVKRASLANLLKIKDGEDRPIFNMSYDKNAGVPFTMMGAPVYFAADMQAISANNLIAAYGDFRQAYLIVDRIGLRVLRDPYSDKPYVAFYSTKRVGGQVINFEAIKLQKAA